MIKTDRLILRPPRPSDAQAVAASIGEWDVANNLSAVPYPYSLGDAHYWINSSVQDHATGAAFNMLIQLKSPADQPIIGCIGLEEQENIPEGPEFGYWLAKEHWGHGYTTEAAAAIRDHAFGVLGYDLLMSGALVDNTASLNILRKLGFVGQRVIKRYFLARDAECDIVELRLTRESWLATRASIASTR